MDELRRDPAHRRFIVSLRRRNNIILSRATTNTLKMVMDTRAMTTNMRKITMGVIKI